MLALLPALGWVIWLAASSDASMQPWRRWLSCFLRAIVVLALLLALSGFQLRRELDLMNTVFLLDRSESIPLFQQEAALKAVRDLVAKKKKEDTAALVPFAAEPALENTPTALLDAQTINAVVAPERTDIAGAIRLGTAAFPEVGQKRLVLISDGNENVGDAFAALMSARPLGVTMDVIPLGVTRPGDVSVQKLTMPPQLNKGQTFEPRVFVESSKAQPGTLRIYRNDQLLGEQKVELNTGRNSFQFPQQLDQTGFYRYDIQVEVNGDPVPQNNRAAGFTSIKGAPRLLILSSDPPKDEPLAAALKTAQLDVTMQEAARFPSSLAELQSYDTIVLCNVPAGDFSREQLRQLESVVRDFGIGLICIGGDQSFTAGGYRGTPLETILPVGMELDSKKVLPKGAVALVMHGMEFNNGNKIARDCALGVLDALGSQDEMGVLLWDGNVRWLFEVKAVGDKQAMGRMISGMNQGDLPNFEEIMKKGYEGLKASTANLKHMIVFSDGDPGAPTVSLMDSLREARVTVSSVLISGHAGPDTMIKIADQGGGRFYDVRSADLLPQIFLKETAVILKSAIFESPFVPTVALVTEPIRGLPAEEYPSLKGYVATSPKPRAEIALISDKGDPVLAHWHYGLGRVAAFTSDARSKWGTDWIHWPRYRQFWTQLSQWALRRLASGEFTADVTVEKGEGQISVEAVDKNGNYRNFLNLQAVVLSPKGEKQMVRLEQSGPGHYDAKFATREIGSYVVNLVEVKDGQIQASQAIGTSVNFSPEFAVPDPNMALLARLAEVGGGKILDPTQPAHNPYLLNRQVTFSARDVWETILKWLLILFFVDIAIRRLDIDPEMWIRFKSKVQNVFGQKKDIDKSSGDSLAALLARKEEVRSNTASASSSQAIQTPGTERLFQAEEPPSLPTEPGLKSTTNLPEPSTTPPADAMTSTTSRLLDAKRKAAKRRDDPK